MNSEDDDELYHQLNELLGIIIELGEENSPLALLLEAEF